MSLRIAFLDSWLADPGRGSGSAVAIGGLEAALGDLGHVVVVHAPRRRSGGAFRRLLFNALLSARIHFSEYDLVVGFDMDGCFLPVAPGPTRRVTALKGVMADELRFERGISKLRFQLLARCEALAASRADRVVVTSEYSARRARDAYDLDTGRLRVVPEGIDLRMWPEPGRLRVASEGAGTTGRGAGLTILSVARQYRRKDTRLLLEAFPAVRRDFPTARLVVVGGGPRLGALRRTALRLGLADAVDFRGEVADREAVRHAYSDADVFALPSRQEGFGIVFLEAMAAGLPIVAARAAAVPEVVPDGRAGLLVPPGDAGALARAIARLLGDPGLRLRMGREGRSHVRGFDWPVVARRFLEAAGLPGAARAEPKRP